MITKEFIEELKMVRHYFAWSYCSENGQIRGMLQAKDYKQAFDPIRAVCYMKTGAIFREDEWIDASEEIGLSLIDSGDLTAAANNVPAPTYGSHTQRLRRQIIGTLKLAPEVDPDVTGWNLSAFSRFVASIAKRKSTAGVGLRTLKSSAAGRE